MTSRVRDLSDRTPLRVKLIAAVLALVTVGLLLAGFAATAALRGYLVGRVDDQLEVALRPFVSGRGMPMDRGPGRLPSDYFVQIADRDGAPVGTLSQPLRGDDSPPVLPRLSVADVRARAGEPFTVPSDGPGSEWRVVVRTLPARDGSVAIATSLGDVESTVARLRAIELVIGVTVLVLVGVLGSIVVRRSLRPLEEVEATALAIAAGDLSRRVPEHDERTEVGRLSAALNGMLAQIESAFRTRESSEAQARESADRMRRFVADASHELRTPLTSIRGFAELYRLGAAGDAAEITRMVRRIEDEAARMGLLVDDLLLLARLDQQRPLEQEPVDLLSLATDAVHDARAVDPDRPIDVALVEGPGAPVVLGDEPRLRQVLGNLVGNALHHTPAGTPVTVRVGTRNGSAPAAVVEVVDRGPGLAPEHAARVFERFYRADESRSRTAGGTGLGLSIVAALVAAHGGTVEVDSDPGQGATFRVVLPLAP